MYVVYSSDCVQRSPPTDKSVVSLKVSVVCVVSVVCAHIITSAECTGGANTIFYWPRVERELVGHTPKTADNLRQK